MKNKVCLFVCFIATMNIGSFLKAEIICQIKNETNRNVLVKIEDKSAQPCIKLIKRRAQEHYSLDKPYRHIFKMKDQTIGTVPLYRIKRCLQKKDTVTMIVSRCGDTFVVKAC